MTGTVRYQACDDAICYIPQTVAVTWIAAASGDSRAQELKQDRQIAETASRRQRVQAIF